jgi:hypothetical protein
VPDELKISQHESVSAQRQLEKIGNEITIIGIPKRVSLFSGCDAWLCSLKEVV